MKGKIVTLIAFLIVFFVMWAIVDIMASTGYGHRKIAEYTGYSRICVDGVEYLQFTSGASVAYNTDGRIKLCK